MSRRACIALLGLFALAIYALEGWAYAAAIKAGRHHDPSALLLILATAAAVVSAWLADRPKTEAALDFLIDRGGRIAAIVPASLARRATREQKVVAAAGKATVDDGEADL